MGLFEITDRAYAVVIVEAGQTTMEYVPLERLVYDGDDAFEWQYAAQEEIDKILDLKHGESMYFQPNRDDKDSKGIITRNYHKQ